MQPGSFTWDVPPEFNFARDVIDALAPSGRRGMVYLDAPGGRRDLTFAEIADASQRWAGALRDAGVGHGDRVLVILPKSPDWLFAMLALLRLGAVAIPGAEQLRTKDVLFRADHGDATTVIAHAANAAEVDGIRAGAPGVRRYLIAGGERAGWTPVEPLVAAAAPFAGNPTAATDLAYIIYTSGTTKDPKGVVHRVAYTYAKRMQARAWFDCTERDVAWCTSSTGWAKSLWNVLLGPWSWGACIVVDEGGFAPESRLDRIRDLGVTLLCQAPTEYRLEAKLADLGTRWRFPQLRHCVSAGEPLNPEVIERWRAAFGLTIFDGYGQTESTLLVANRPGREVRPGSMGMPTPGHDIAVIDARGAVCAPGEIGDVALRGRPPTLFAGYYKNDAETRASFRGEWFITGDRAQIDDDGYYWFVGRADDVISSGAYRIGPFEVESALLEHPAVLESAVVGSPDADRGNIVKAFVVLRAGITGDDALVRELQDHCKRVTAPYKYPREIAFVADLPKTRSGKIRRVELRQAELRAKGATAASGFV
jgi:acetyl-CoA synthetase/medium-chain acyl-CoA synthetase